MSGSRIASEPPLECNLSSRDYLARLTLSLHEVALQSGLELLQPLWFATRRNEWVSLDPGSAVLIKTCFQTPESRCAPVEWYPQRRSFSSDF